MVAHAIEQAQEVASRFEISAKALDVDLPSASLYILPILAVLCMVNTGKVPGCLGRGPAQCAGAAPMLFFILPACSSTV